MNLIRYWSLRFVLRADRWTVRWTGFVLSRVSTALKDRKREREGVREREIEKERGRGVERESDRNGERETERERERERGRERESEGVKDR